MDETPSTTTRTWSTRGREARVVVTDPATLGEAVGLVGDVLDAVDRAAGRGRADSELTLMLDGPRADDCPVELSPLLADLVREALDAARATDGALDPTLGAWPPPPGVRRVPGWRTPRLEGLSLWLPPDLGLDLDATAAAYAVDRAAELVAGLLATGVLVALGDDLATAGPAPEGGWRVLVQDAAADPTSHVGLPPGSALATASSRGADRVWRSVTVAAPTCGTAYAASRATLAKGPAGLDWLARQGLPARLVDRRGVARFAGGWPADTAA